MGFTDCFSTKNVLRTSGIACLLPGIPLMLAPAVIVSQMFAKGDGENVKEDFLARSAGIAMTTAGVMSIASPTRDMLHIRIAQSVASTVISGKRAKECDEKSDGNAVVSKILFGVDVAFLIALLLAKKNDDDDSGKPWHKIMP
jgi:hypothetical protein